jgi:hypothetical protein
MTAHQWSSQQNTILQLQVYNKQTSHRLPKTENQKISLLFRHSQQQSCTDFTLPRANG